MLRRSLGLAFILFLLVSINVQAQEPTTFAVVEVDLWPEFDRPSLLVIYRITLSPQMKLPFEVRLSIPSSVELPNAVAYRGPDGILINLENYAVEEDGEWSRLVFLAPTPDLQIEFYDPGLAKENNSRRFEYRWRGDYAVESFLIQVQQPVNASQMRLSPSLGSGSQGSDGLVYFSQEIGELKLGRTFTIQGEYLKEDDELSVNRVPIGPGGPLDETAQGRATLLSALPWLLPWLLGFLGLALIVGGLIWYRQSGREAPKTKRKRRTRRKADSRAGEEETRGGDVYCHQCGKRALPGDRFCRACGTKLRIE